MAEWRKVAKFAILADKRIDTREVNILREALFADNKINQSELEFLKELRNEATSYVKAFTDLYIEAIKARMLEDGKIKNDEAKWLRNAIFADGKIDEDEKRMLEELKTEAQETSPAFDELYAECMK